MTPPDLSLIVFAYNEADNVAPVLDELRVWLTQHAPATEIVFVDDGSTDGTYAVAEHALIGTRHRLLRHPHNRGIGAALKTGTRVAAAPWVTFMPADGQIAPQMLQRLSQAIENDDVDLVLSVYDRRDDGLDRKLLSWGVRALIHTIHGVRLRSDGPYLFRRALFRAHELPPDSFFLNFEFPIRMLRTGARIKTVTITCRPRRAGHSKSASLATVLLIARDLVAMRLRDLRPHTR